MYTYYTETLTSSHTHTHTTVSRYRETYIILAVIIYIVDRHIVSRPRSEKTFVPNILANGQWLRLLQSGSIVNPEGLFHPFTNTRTRPRVPIR